MNRWISTAVGVVAISAVLYRPQATVPAPGGLSPAKAALPRGGAQAQQPTGTGIASAMNAASANPCMDVEDNPSRALLATLSFYDSFPARPTGRLPALTDSKDILSGSKKLIVTVPDPVHGHLALWFDRSVDTIILAAQQSGYELDSYWLPWSDAAPKTEPDCSYRLQRGLEMERKDREPGLLVFRGPDNGKGIPKSLLLVFLVAETPTSGINKLAFSRAVDDVFTWGLCSEKACLIPVAGPAFSGSVHSFMEAVWSVHNPTDKLQKRRTNVQFRIVSGSMTGTSAVKDLAWHCSQDYSFCKEARTTLWDDNTRLEYLLQFLRWQVFSSPRIAIISESATTFGNSPFFYLPGIPGRNPSSQASPEHKAPSGSTIRFKANRATVIWMQFPREISRLREAYEENAQILVQGGSQPAAEPRRLLPLILNDTPLLREDAPPIFSKEQTPLSEEMEMASLSRELRRENIQYAGIVATDPLDTVFLIRFLQRTNPGTQLFVLEPDMLFLRALDERPPLGLLAVSSYPLFLRDQYWTEPNNPQRRFFPDEYAKALYNACVVLLDRPDAALEQFAPNPYNPTWKQPSHFHVAWTRDANAVWPHAHVPLTEGPLWLTMVGRDGYWPITVLTPNPPPQGPQREPMPSLWQGTWYVLICLSIIYLLLFFFGQSSNHQWLENFRLSGCVQKHIAPRAFYLLLLAVVFLLIQSVMSLPTWKVYDSGSWWKGINIVSVACLLVVVTWLMVILLHNLKAGLAVQKQGVRKSSLTLATVSAYVFWSVMVLAAAAVFSWYWWRNVEARNYYGFFLSYRTAQLLSGVSPALPLILLLAGIGVLAWIRLGSLVMLGTRPQLPLLWNDTEFDASQQRADKALRDAVYDPASQGVAVVLFVLALFLITSRRSTISAEARTFNNACLAGFVVLCWLILNNCGRLLIVWRELKQVLHRLEQHPLREAFSRLPKQYSWPPIWNLSSVLWKHRLLARSVYCLRKLAGQTCDKPLQEAADLLEKGAKTIIEKDEHKRCTPQSAVCELQSSLRLVAEAVASIYLTPEWKRGYSDSLAAEENTSRTSETREQAFEARDRTIVAEEFVALRYVDYIRYTCAQLRQTVFFLAAAFILCLLSVKSYPFQTHHGMGWLMILIFAIISIAVIKVFAEMETDSILSRLSNTEPGKLDKEFYFRLATYGALPLFTLIAAHVPAISGFFYSWIQPGLQSIK